MKNNKIDYEFTDGINIERTIFRSGQNIGRMSISQAIDALPNPISLESLNNKLRTFKNHAGHIAVQMSMFESDKPDGSLNVVLTGWSGDWNKFLARNEMRYILANQDSSSDILFINHAGQGDSDPLPSSISQKVAKSGSFQPIGELYNESLSSILPNYDEVSLFGHSYGGRIAIALAGALSKKPRNLNLLDPTGSQNLNGAKGMIKAFKSEDSNVLQYNRHNSGDNLDIQLKFDDIFLANTWDYASKDGLQDIVPRLVQQFIHQPASLSRNMLEHDLMNTIPNIKDRIRLTSPEFSKLNNAAVVSNILKRVSKYNKDIYVMSDILKKHSHAFTSGHPEVFGYIIRS